VVSERPVPRCRHAPARRLPRAFFSGFAGVGNGPRRGYIPSATRTVFCLVVDLLKMIYGWIQLTIVKYWNWSMADITTLLE
jgi:hypothetical protein